MCVGYVLSSRRDGKVFLRKERNPVLGFCGRGQLETLISVSVIIQYEYSLVVLYGTSVLLGTFYSRGLFEEKGNFIPKEGHESGLVTQDGSVLLKELSSN